MRDLKLGILKLIREYATTERGIDEEFIIRLLSIIVKERRLEDYIKVNETKITREGNSSAFYNYKYRRIDLDLTSLKKETFDFVSLFVRNNSLKLYSSYILICEALSRESEYASQQREIHSNREDICTDILRTSYNLSKDITYNLTKDEIKSMHFIERLRYNYNKMRERERVQTYHLFHSFAPEERLADIFSKRVTSGVLNLLNEALDGCLTGLDAFYRDLALDDLLRTYRRADEVKKAFHEKPTSPTMTYFELMELENFERFEGIENDLDMRTRFEYGLALYDAEIDKLTKLRESFEKRYYMRKR